MIKVNDKEIGAVYYGNKAISAIYHGAKLVWSAIRSCFGNGGWHGEMGWDKYDGWRD